MIRLPACCYGKIPVHAEFVRYNRGVPELGQLDRWFQRGIGRARREHRRAWASLEAVPPSRFVYTSPDTGAVLAGICCFSRDRAGRPYPFVVGSRTTDRPVDRAFDCLPLGLADFMADAEALVAGEWHEAELDEFREQLGNVWWHRRDEQSIAEFVRYLRSENAGDAWAAMLPTLDEAGRERVLEELWQTVQPPYPPRAVIRLPSTGAPAEIAFWIAVVRAWTPTGAPPTLVLWNDPATEPPSTLRLVMGELAGEYFSPVFWPGSRSEFARDVPRTTPSIARGRRRGESRRPPLGSAAAWSGTMGALLEAIAGTGDRGST